MKRFNKYPLLVYSDKDFISQMTQEIEAAKVQFQKLLDLYNSFDLRSITTYRELFRLIYDPHGVWKDTGSSDPLPHEVYIQAGLCKRSIHNGRLELWLIEDGKKVVINDGEFQHFTHINDITVMNEAQANFARDIVKYVELSNSISKTLMEFPGKMPGVPFSLTGRFFPYLNCLKLENEALQELLKVL